MGVIYDLLNELDIALEAEDITSEVESGTNRTLGKRNDDGGDEALAGGTDNSDGEIDTNTDDILGATDDNEDINQDDTDSDTSSLEDEPSDEDVAGGDGDDLENSDAGADDPVEDSLEENDNSFESIRKRKMHKQLLDLYTTLHDDIKVVNEFVPKASDDATIKALTNINNNLVQCRDYTYRILTEEFKTMEYPILLKKYVAINRIYDLCIRTLQTYFDTKRKEEEK